MEAMTRGDGLRHSTRVVPKHSESGNGNDNANSETQKREQLSFLLYLQFQENLAQSIDDFIRLFGTTPFKESKGLVGMAGKEVSQAPFCGISSTLASTSAT